MKNCNHQRINPFSAAGISEDNDQGWGRGRLVKFWGQSSAEDIILWYTSEPERGYFYFKTLRLISKGERTKMVPAYFIIELSTSFLVSPALVNAKRFFFLRFVLTVFHDRFKVYLERFLVSLFFLRRKSDNGYQVGRRISSDNHSTILNWPDQFYPMKARWNYSVLVQGRGVPNKVIEAWLEVTREEWVDKRPQPRKNICVFTR